MKATRLKSIYVALAIWAIALTACTSRKHADESRLLANADRSYSALSARDGMNAAFLAMFDSAGVMLRANHPPVEGYPDIRKLLLSENDSAFNLTWEPSLAKVSASGDMGFTYGIYKITDRATGIWKSGGTYATVWGKTENGEWKAMLDTGNPGLGKPE